MAELDTYETRGSGSSFGERLGFYAYMFAVGGGCRTGACSLTVVATPEWSSEVMRSGVKDAGRRGRARRRTRPRPGLPAARHGLARAGPVQIRSERKVFRLSERSARLALDPPGKRRSQMRPFRFGIQTSKAAQSARSGGSKAQRIEELGYSTLFIPDHFTDQLAPMVGADVGGRRDVVSAARDARAGQRLPAPAGAGEGVRDARRAIGRSAWRSGWERAGCGAITRRPASRTTVPACGSPASRKGWRS